MAAVQALSHCVFNTVRDMCDLIEMDPSKIHVLRDCSSCIEGEGFNKKLILQVGAPMRPH